MLLLDSPVCSNLVNTLQHLASAPKQVEVPNSHLRMTPALVYPPTDPPTLALAAPLALMNGQLGILGTSLDRGPRRKANEQWRPPLLNNVSPVYPNKHFSLETIPPSSIQAQVSHLVTLLPHEEGISFSHCGLSFFLQF